MTEFRPPQNVVAMQAGKTLEGLLVAGEIAATIGVQVSHPDVAPLFPDAAQTGLQRLAREGYYPINHVLVAKTAVLESSPDLTVKLFEAFTQAKQPYLERLRRNDIATPSKADQMYRQVLEITGRDPLPYGIGPNRAMLETLISYATQQQIIARPCEVEELFTPRATALARLTGRCS